MVAITSNPPFEIRLEGSAGSYSQIAALFSTTAVLVMCDITSMVARLMTCAIHLSYISIVVSLGPVQRIHIATHMYWFFLWSHASRFRRLWIFATVLQIVPFTDVLSRVTPYSWWPGGVCVVKGGERVSHLISNRVTCSHWFTYLGPFISD